MKFALLGAAAVAATALVGASQAQPVISNPGRCAQYYPDANCQNLGPGNPYTDGGYPSWQNNYAYIGHPQVRHRRRHYRH